MRPKKKNPNKQTKLAFGDIKKIIEWKHAVETIDACVSINAIYEVFFTKMRKSQLE